MTTKGKLLPVKKRESLAWVDKANGQGITTQEDRAILSMAKT